MSCKNLSAEWKWKLSFLLTVRFSDNNNFSIIISMDGCAVLPIKIYYETPETAISPQ
jgi:hypothetical protein